LEKWNDAIRSKTGMIIGFLRKRKKVTSNTRWKIFNTKIEEHQAYINLSLYEVPRPITERKKEISIKGHWKDVRDSYVRVGKEILRPRRKILGPIRNKRGY